jgi:dTDP-4-amino-4,6-dideoxygalactose transaminase
MTTSNVTNIPFLDLVTPHQQLKEELVSVLTRVLSNAGFIGGPLVEGFERDFAAFCDAQHCVGVSSGTDALRFALMAAGVAPGDSVITVPHTFIATVEAITQSGAVPEFVDIDERTYNMDPAKLRDFLENRCDRDPESNRPVSRRTRRVITAVVPVHLYGQVADMDAILALAEEYNLIVVEDACQAHGAEYFSQEEQRWRKAGSMGAAAAFSFYPGKNLGACGEAGAVTTNNLELAQKIRMLRDHGQAAKYYHEIEGYNGRLDAIQAGFLHAKLSHLADWNASRRKKAEIYRTLLSEVEGVILPYEPSWSRAIYHLYVIRVKERDALQRQLKGAGVGTGIHYPIPLHLQTAYHYLGHQAGDFPVVERVVAEIISLPMYPQLTHSQQEFVAQSVLEIYLSQAQEAL